MPLSDLGSLINLFVVSRGDAADPDRRLLRSPPPARTLGRAGRGARAGDHIWLLGTLGASNTQPPGVRGRARCLDEVTSPATLMANYAGRLPLFRLDLYRLSGSAGGRGRHAR
jgi:hypothetical protein